MTSDQSTDDNDRLEATTATVNALALAIVVEQLTLNSGCGGANYEEGCAQCEAIKACQEAVDNAGR